MISSTAGQTNRSPKQHYHQRPRPHLVSRLVGPLRDEAAQEGRSHEMIDLHLIIDALEDEEDDQE